jgi:hypothetical protein
MPNGNKMVDGQLVEMTDAEQKEYDARNSAWADGKADRDLVDLRHQRDALLKDTDWLANSDVTMSDAMRTYRQSLRDITDTYQSLNDDGFAFPTKPE